MRHPIIEGLETLRQRADQDITWCPRWVWDPNQSDEPSLLAWWKRVCDRIPGADQTNVGRYEGDE